MVNPFVYGEIAPRSAFVNRRSELDRLVRDLLAGQKIFLISPRRYGKSSLVHQALRRVARRGTLTLDITVSAFSSYIAFLEGFARATLGTETRLDRARAWLREAIGAAPSEVRYAPQEGLGPFAVSFGSASPGRDLSRLASEVFALPARVAATRRRAVAVSLDEFQAIAAFDGKSVEHTLRAAVQHQRRVGYVFAGSEPSLMEQMLAPRRPFYKAGPVMRLGKVPADEFAEFIESRLARTGLRPEPGLGEAIVELAANLPYDVQRLAHEMWDDLLASGTRAAGLDQLHATLRRLLREHDTLFEATWQRLTLAQRATLRAVVVEDGRGLLSADSRTRHRLGGPSSVQASLLALSRDDVIVKDGSRYVVVDSLMREWVARKTF